VISGKIPKTQKTHKIGRTKSPHAFHTSYNYIILKIKAQNEVPLTWNSLLQLELLELAF